ncbi:MAG: SiaB family protein kinase [Bacteroidales bacterium]|nr:SiaB family protein kinase [Bacteroidales bacterium]
MFDTEQFNEFLKEQILDEEKIIYEYDGFFDQDHVKDFAFKLSKLTKDFDVTQRRLFYVFVELAQNVGFYSDQKATNGIKEVGKGHLIIYEKENHIGFIIGNVINTGALNVLHRKCRIINSMDRDSLREFKRHQRNLIPGTNGGAHIGLIMVALTTREKLNFRIREINDDFSFFTLNVKLLKEKIK